jgi:hypothetical protein
VPFSLSGSAINKLFPSDKFTESIGSISYEGEDAA